MLNLMPFGSVPDFPLLVPDSASPILPILEQRVFYSNFKPLSNRLGLVGKKFKSFGNLIF